MSLCWQSFAERDPISKQKSEIYAPQSYFSGTFEYKMRNGSYSVQKFRRQCCSQREMTEQENRTSVGVEPLHNIGWPMKKRNSRFSGLCFNQVTYETLLDTASISSTYSNSKIIKFGWEILFYETFLMDCHFRDLPDFQSFEARWQIYGKSQKWQSITN